MEVDNHDVLEQQLAELNEELGTAKAELKEVKGLLKLLDLSDEEFDYRFAEIPENKLPRNVKTAGS